MSTDSERPRPVLLAEYRPPFFLVDEIKLQVDLYDDHALVRASLRLRRNPAAASGEANLALEGEELELLELRLDGAELPPERYLVQGDGNRDLTGRASVVGVEEGSAPTADPGAAAGGTDDNRGRLLILAPPEQCTLETVSRIYPAANTALEGLYRSGPMFCTQCEPEGFRRITWYPDRPDVSAPFTVTISADKQQCPVLLAGGNPAGQGEWPNGRHWASFKDPFPKPSYLFALVAGDLVGIHDHFTTASGREVALAIYVEAHNREQCKHAMAALQKAMRWDEETFGLEYDLDHYLIVAVDDFTMGAMENKGLNIFNARYVLARPESATDDDFENIEAVIAHEYFHNWTGNRVTCRDWFQLSLKEGLTVFRDQLFSQHLHSPGVKRINDVRLLREHQFAEDAGPLAHPVRPESYLEINNFYTLTVYEKGAELVRMLHTLLGPEKFRVGLRLYLTRHDGGAATIEDFLAAMAEAGGRDLAGFARWYARAGTPVLQVTDDYDPVGGRYRLRLSQQAGAPISGKGQGIGYGNGVGAANPVEVALGRGAQNPVATGSPAAGRMDAQEAAGASEAGRMPAENESLPGFAPPTPVPKPTSLAGASAPAGHDQYRPAAAPLLIPVAFGLLEPAGGEVAAGLLELVDHEREFVFDGLAARPVPSLLRGFSAPVRLAYDYREEQLRLLLAHDSDPFCRWEAGQRLSGGLILELARKWRAGEEQSLPAAFVDTYRQLLARLPALEDKSLAAQLPALPAEDYLAEQMAQIDVEALHAARELVRRELAVALRSEWMELYHHSREEAAALATGAKDGGSLYNPRQAGCRRLQNLALSFLLALDEAEVVALARSQFIQADNMTDTLAAMRGLVHAAALAQNPIIAGRPVTGAGPVAQVAVSETRAVNDPGNDAPSGDVTGRDDSASATAAAREVLAEFAARWRHDHLVLDKWFSVQATAPAPVTLEQVKALMDHPAFRLANPNRVRALIGAFAAGNAPAFHRADGAGYRFLTEQILALDPLNPQVAARLAARFSRWRRYDPARQALMRAELSKIAAAPKLSRDVYEMVSKSLGQPDAS
ncbi:M1 family metallopeptidase [Desulfurivibrio dismutans]|uniref:M1 family metallopeptidase n=1 Tax=Desulfurivibrio dismutans TaxID=1398908 RepID=UPI0023DAF844|nr:M1 family metallopeptidase [Desulfurivibrio alkaliphilus]MDF1614501.1 aminopeptidase N [Desulfurivibrio alkaliphilus]